MIIQLTDTTITIIREDTDAKIYGIINAAGESKLLHKVKTWLNANDPVKRKWIKKRMWRDGHMMDMMQQYVRTTGDNYQFFYNIQWASWGLEELWNAKTPIIMEIQNIK